MRDILAMLLSFAYIFALLVSVELVRKWRHYPVEFTRKAIHIGVGMGMWAALALFEHWQILLILPASFVILNAVFLRFRLFKAMDSSDGATLGTVYYPLSCLLLLGLFHQGFPRGREYIAMAGIMSMTYGDAFAAIIGKAFGRHIYHIPGGGKRSVEGSIAGAVFTFIAVAITLVVLSPLSISMIVLASLLAALTEMALEAFSPWGLDNLTVPLGVAAMLFLVGF